MTSDTTTHSSTNPGSNFGPSFPSQGSEAPAEPSGTQPTPNQGGQDAGTGAPLIAPQATPAAQQTQPPASQAETDWTQMKDPDAPTQLHTGETSSTSTPEWLTDLQAKYQDSALPGMLMAAGVILLIFIMLRRLARKPKQTHTSAPDERITALRDQAAASITPIERALAEAEELTRRLAATLDNKADRLDLLIQEADRKLEELNRANAQVARQTPLTPAEPPAARPRTIDPSLMDRARVEQDRAERAPSYQRHEPEPARRENPARDNGGDPVHHRVWALADDGVPTVEIARSLNQPIGQVELILNLRKSG